MSALICDIDDLENFAKHPIAAYDPHYTKDIDSWRLAFDESVHFLRELILSNPSRKVINYCHGIYYDIIKQVEAFERHTGTALIPLHVPGRSLLHSFYAGDDLTPH